MSMGDDTILALREALRVSPNNLPLRQHLADTLIGLGRAEEAEHEYRQALALSPENEKLQAGLARAFHQQGKKSHALALLETLNKSPTCPGEAHLLFARILLGDGERESAARHYRKAIELRPDLADMELAKELDKPSIHVRPEVTPDTPKAPLKAGGEDWKAEPEEDGPVDSEVERPSVKFKDVGGMETVKDEIRIKIIHPLAHPELYEAYGKKVGGGILLYGPPGCGKTHLARATAGEIQAAFLSVGISDVLDMWIGSSERNLHAWFERARRSRPCVIFFDEVDALAASRSDMRHAHNRHIINQFLSEMDGVDVNNTGLLILAATNAPWHVDSAFRRPGRFDRILFVPPPDAPARAAILRILMTGKPSQDVDFDQLARKTDSFSGADLKAVVDMAVEAKLRRAMKEGVVTPVTTKDLATAAGAIKPSTREWFASARNYAMYANQGGIYDDVLNYIKKFA
jgi:transitional endoplasmic reticulum ATPase